MKKSPLCGAVQKIAVIGLENPLMTRPQQHMVSCDTLIAFESCFAEIHAPFFLALQSRSESLASVYSADGGRYGTVNVKGEVEFGLVFNLHTGSLELAIKQCKDLAAVDTKRNRSDP